MFKYVIFSVLAYLAYSEWTPDPLCPYPSEVVTNFPYYGDCSYYWACFEGSKFLVQCPIGQEFDSKTSECASPEVAQCDPYISTTTTTESTGSTTTRTTTTESSTTTSSTTTDSGTTTEGPYPQCPNSEDIIYLPDIADCSKYWECFEGSSYMYHCPDGLWWNQAVLQCDYPGDYCNISTTTKGSTVTPTPTIPTSTTSTSGPTTTPNPDDITCPNPNDQSVYFPVVGDCTKYWECFEGNKYLLTCPEGQWWHQEATKCEQPGDYCQN